MDRHGMSVNLNLLHLTSLTHPLMRAIFVHIYAFFFLKVGERESYVY